MTPVKGEKRPKRRTPEKVKLKSIIFRTTLYLFPVLWEGFVSHQIKQVKAGAIHHFIPLESELVYIHYLYMEVFT